MEQRTPPAARPDVDLTPSERVLALLGLDWPGELRAILERGRETHDYDRALREFTEVWDGLAT